jgi:uncharacterized FAD-dependent dehydrogenase
MSHDVEAMIVAVATRYVIPSKARHIGTAKGLLRIKLIDKYLNKRSGEKMVAS